MSVVLSSTTEFIPNRTLLRVPNCQTLTLISGAIQTRDNGPRNPEKASIMVLVVVMVVTLIASGFVAIGILNSVQHSSCSVAQIIPISIQPLNPLYVSRILILLLILLA